MICNGSREGADVVPGSLEKRDALGILRQSEVWMTSLSGFVSDVLAQTRFGTASEDGLEWVPFHELFAAGASTANVRAGGGRRWIELARLPGGR